ncbi:hypothetical protein [Pandoraea oxalativorans]|uniref:hypothetical protein n=1 Tax=Pandoraea oxalativorans TaxID=573737 RepID=UPI0012F4CA5A|nr:hypothetical protein [Pandoraea oxalativorans]
MTSTKNAEYPPDSDNEPPARWPVEAQNLPVTPVTRGIGSTAAAAQTRFTGH